jgi:hypothetical protein
MFYTDDVKGEYERIKTRGAEFTMPPTEVTASKIAMLNDTCGNLVQVTQLARYEGRRRRFRFVRVYPGSVRAAKGGRQRSLHR